MLTLRTLGSLDLRDSEGNEIAAVLSQPKRFGLLVYLALARPQGLHRRDTVLTLFWPERDDAQARNTLSQGLSFLRQHLSQEVIVGRGTEEVGLASEMIRVDVEEFEVAIADRCWAEALDLYGGDFLRGFHVGDAWGFEDWVDSERMRLREAAADAAWSLAKEQIDRGSLVEAERTAQRALGLVWTEETPVRGFIEALGKAGDRAAALNFYEQFCERLQRELEMEPSPKTSEVAESLRSGEEPAPEPTDSSGTPPRPDREPPPRPDLETVDLGAGVGGGGTVTVPHTRSESEEEGTGFADEVESRSGMGGRGRWVFPAAALIAAAGYFGFSGDPDGPALPEGSVVESPLPGDDRPVIAVLPFEDLSPDTARAYFAAGVREDLTTKLNGVSTIAVIHGASADRYGNRPDRPGDTQVASELGADFLVRASVRLNGDSASVTVRLIEGSTGVLRWSDTYLTPFSPEVYTRVQAELAQKIAFELRAPVSPEESEWMEAVPTRSQAALEAYWKGLDAFRDERRIAILNFDLPSERYLREAIRLDPEFALAHAHLALALTFSERPEDRNERARHSAERALALAGGVPEAHLALMLSWGYNSGQNHDVEKAARHLELAMELAPDNVTVLREFARAQEVNGDREAAIQTYERAGKLDPRDPLIPRALGETFMALHRWDDALDAFAREIALSEGGARGHMVQAYVHMARGDLERARAALSEMLNRSPVGPYAYVPYVHYTATKTLMTPAERQDALEAWLARDRVVPLKTWEKQYFTAVHEQEFGSAERAKSLWDSLYVTFAPTGDALPGGSHMIRDALILMGVGERDAALTAARGILSRFSPRCGWSRWAHDRCRTSARILAHFGEFDEAIDLIEEMLPAPSYFTVHILEADRIWDPLRDHPRFQALLEKYRDDVEH